MSNCTCKRDYSERHDCWMTYPVADCPEHGAMVTERAAIADAVDAVRLDIALMSDPYSRELGIVLKFLADRIRAGHYAPTGEGGDRD